MPRRSLALLLALHVVAISGPASAQAAPRADDPVAQHRLAGQRRAEGQHLEAARAWLRALDTVDPTPATLDDVRSHFCEAMQSLIDASAGPDEGLQVAAEIGVRRPRLEASADLLRQHDNPTDTAVCLEHWQRLSQRAPSADPERSITPEQDAQPSPAPAPAPNVPRGKWAGLGISLVGVGAGSIMLGIGGTRMKDSYERAKDGWAQSGYIGSVRPCGDNGAATPEGVAADCQDYRSQRLIAAVGVGVLAASLVSTAVFAGLLGRHRTQRLAVTGSRLRGGALLQATWKF